MASIDILDQKGSKVGEFAVEDHLLSLSKNNSLVQEGVVMQLSSRRQGTASTKTKGLVRGGGKKPWKQKGTGRARAGSIRSPIWKGGGTVFGPLPRKYQYSFPRKKMRLAMASTLGAKIGSGNVTVLDSLDFPEGKTKLLVNLLQTLGLKGKVLFVVQEEAPSIKRAARNLRGVSVMMITEMNLYDLLWTDQLIVTKEVMPLLSGAWV